MGWRKATGGDPKPWYRSWIRDVTVLIVVAEALAWVVHRADAAGNMLKHWPLWAMLTPGVLGLVWSVGRIYRVGPSRQGVSIAALIASVLGLLAAPFLYGAWMSRTEP